MGWVAERRSRKVALASSHHRLYRQLTEIFRTDLPVAILYPLTTPFVANRRLHGLSTPYRIPVGGEHGVRVDRGGGGRAIVVA